MRFNRDILECKYRTAHCNEREPPDLIETYWNVNNYLADIKVETAKGFNRDILECKFSQPHFLQRLSMGFNRDILECKLTHLKRILYRTMDLIETYWNVNITDNWYRLYAKPI